MRLVLRCASCPRAQARAFARSWGTRARSDQINAQVLANPGHQC